MGIKRNTFWLNFIKTYKKHRELWDVKSDEYKRRDKKAEAWALLHSKYLQIEPDATVEVVKRKVISLRSSYRRELLKIKKCESMGEVYVPNLWYFKELEFLRDEETTEINESDTNDMSSIDFETVDIGKNDDILKDEETTFEIHNTSSSKRPTSYRQTEFRSKTPRLLDGTRRTNEREESDIFAESWALLFRKLEPDQKIHAKRAIEEILWQGQLGKLGDTSTTFFGE